MHRHPRRGRWPGPHPDSHDVVLADAEVPAIFPYGGFGSLLVAGELSRDGQTFFARRIVAFSPELRRLRRLYLPLRKCDFYNDRALCRDLRRSWSYGWIQLPSIRFGIGHGINGNICWERRSRSKARSYRAVKPQTSRGVGTRHLGDCIAKADANRA